MGENSAKNRKIYYTMGEVTEMFDVNPSLIRFWEQKFDILKPHKNKKGNRLFTPSDLENLKLIYHLVKEKKMTLAGAQKRLKENREGLEQDLVIIEKLQKIRSFLLEVKQELKVGEDPGVEIVVENEVVYGAALLPRPEEKDSPLIEGEVEKQSEEKPAFEPIPIPFPDPIEEVAVEPVIEVAQELEVFEELPAENDAKSSASGHPQIIEQTLF